MSHDKLRSTISELAKMAAAGFAHMRFGEVTSFDGSAGVYAVKVMLQPDEIETGWLPIKLLMAGSAYGAYFGPSIGDQAAVTFQEGDATAGICIGFLPSDDDPPPAVASGEIHLIAKGATASVIMKPDGTIASAGAWTHTGTLKVTDAVEFDAALDVKGAAHLESTLQIDGKTTAAEVDTTSVKIGGVTVIAP